MFDWQAERAPPAFNPGTTTQPLSTVFAPATVTPSTATTTPRATVAAPKPSFAQALRGNTVISDPLPVPSIRGDILLVKITDAAYCRGLDACKTNLRGRLVLSKGDKPYSSKDLAAKLQTTWKVKGPWHLTSLGREYFEFY